MTNIIHTSENSFDSTLAVGRVYELHKKIVGPYDNYVCDHCSRLTVFASDVIPYPCPTVKALEGEQR